MPQRKFPSMAILPFLSLTFLLCSCGSRQPQAETSAVSATEVNEPFASFSEDLQSSVKSLEFRPGQSMVVPVTLRNTGSTTWASAGKYPVTISYKWFDRGKQLPIEGERTLFPRAVKPGESVDVPVKVTAPQSGTDLVVKICLVQEGVAWFLSAGAKPLEIPVTVR